MAERASVPRGLEQAAAISWRLLVVAAAVALTLVVGVRLRLAVLPAILALFAAAVFIPPARWLESRGLRRGLSTAVVLLLAAGVLIGVVTLLAPGIRREFGDLGPTLRLGVQDVSQWLEEGPLKLPPSQLRNVGDEVREWFEGNSDRLVSGVVTGATLAFEILAGALLTIVLTFFFIKDGDRIVAWMVSHIPPDHSEVTRGIGRRTWRVLGAYWRGIAIVGVVDATFIGIGLIVIGVPLVIPLMLLTFVGAFFPLVGATAAGIVAALVALVTGGVVKALLVTAVVIAVQQIEGHVLQPVVLGRAMSLHPIVILLALTTGAVLAGVIGAFLAVPTAAALAAAGNELRLREASSTVQPDRPEGSSTVKSD
jgi:predicted PurR-regulated permease PerM